MNRRDFLTRAAAGAGFVFFPSLALAQNGDDGFIVLEARPGKARLKGAWGPATDIWSYNAGAPGPEIRVKQGEEVKVRLINKLPQPTSIHWHGVRIPNAMDGVPGLTQGAVAPGERFDYVLPRPMPAPSGIIPISRPMSRWRGQKAKIIAIDGQPVAPQDTVDRPLSLAPAQRVDLAMDADLAPGSRISLVENEQDLPVDLATIKFGRAATKKNRPGGEPLFPLAACRQSPIHPTFACRCS